MIPLITDAVLTGAIATSRMVESGRDYWRRGRVGELRAEDDRGVVWAAVMGSDRSPYQVELRFRPGKMVATICTCPVGIGCKHAAAVLLALQARQDAGQDARAVMAGPGGGGSPGRSPA